MNPNNPKRDGEMPDNPADQLLKKLLSGKFGPLPIVHEPAEDGNGCARALLVRTDHCHLQARRDLLSSLVHVRVGPTPKPTCPPGQGGTRKRVWLRKEQRNG